MGVLSIGFNDFKKLASNHRVYYFQGDDFFEFLFLSDGIIVKTFLLANQINNVEQFFSDKLFYGAVKLDFRVDDNRFNDIINAPLISSSTDFNIQSVQTEEVKNEDIQQAGVGNAGSN